MKKFATVVCLFLLAAGLGFSQSTARLSEMRASRGVDPKLQSPIDVAETFGPEAKPIYLTVKLSDGPKGTQVRIAVFYLQDGKPQQIAVQDYRDIYGTGYLSYRISPPASGWPLGKYKAVFHLNEREQGSIGFAVVSGKATPGHPEYRTFTSSQYGFSIQYPAEWVEGEKGAPSVVCMFLANAANSPVASLNVQVVPINGADDSRSKEAVNLVAQQLIDQIKAGGGRVRGDTWATAGSLSGRELDMEYTFKGSKLRQRQFLTYFSAKVFIVILTVDQSLYSTYAGHYLNATKSLSFSKK